LIACNKKIDQVMKNILYAILILLHFVSCRSNKKIETLIDTKNEIVGVWEPMQNQNNINPDEYPILELDTSYNSLGPGSQSFTTNTINLSKFGLVKVIGNTIYNVNKNNSENKGKILHDISKSFLKIQSPGIVDIHINTYSFYIKWKFKLLNSNEAILNDNIKYVKSNRKPNKLINEFDGIFFNKFYKKYNVITSDVNLQDEPPLAEDVDHIGTILSITNNYGFNNMNYVTQNVPRFLNIKINNGYRVTVNFEDWERFKEDPEMRQLFDQLIIGRKINFQLFREGSGVLSQLYFSKLRFIY